MNHQTLSHIAIASAAAACLAMPASAETVLRLNEVPVGEIDPAKASDNADSQLMFNIYDTLVLPRQGGPGHVPHLAKSWEGDGKTFTFKLRDDVKFQSGNPLTAADVVYSLERTKEIGKGLSFLFGNVKGAKSLDELTVEFTLETVYSPFIASLTRLPIIDSKLVKANEGSDNGEAYLSANGAGTGAYKVVSHNPQDETVLTKNSGYFLGVPAKAPDKVRLRYGLEPSTVRTLLAQGEHEIGSQWMPPEVAKALAKDGFQLLHEGGVGAFYLKLNTTKPPLDDVHCRLALVNAFDYTSALKLIEITDKVSKGTPSTGAIPVGMFGAKPAGNAFKQNMPAARKHMEQCSHDLKESSIELSWIAEVPLEERFALLMQANLAELGVKSEIIKMPWALFAEQVSDPAKTPHVSQLFVNAVTGDPDTLLYGMYYSGNAGTWQSPEHLGDKRVDELLEQGRTATADADRDRIYGELNDRLIELAPTIYVNDNTAVFVADPKIRAPALSDPGKAFGLSAIGFSFRLMEMN